MLRQVFVVCACIAVTLAAVTTTSDDVYVVALSTYNNCGGSRCCSEGCNFYSRSASLNRSPFPIGLPTTVAIQADCTGGCNDCYSSSTANTVLDITQAVQDIQRPKRGNLAVKCQSTQGSFQFVSLKQFYAKPGAQGGYFPAPYTANCSTTENSSSACRIGDFTTLNSWDITRATGTNQAVHIPLDSLLNTNSTGILLGFSVTFNGSVDDCSFGGSGYGAVSCTADIVAA